MINTETSQDKKDYMKFSAQPIESVSSEESAITLTDSKTSNLTSSSCDSVCSSELSKDHR